MQAVQVEGAQDQILAMLKTLYGKVADQCAAAALDQLERTTSRIHLAAIEALRVKMKSMPAADMERLCLDELITLVLNEGCEIFTSHDFSSVISGVSKEDFQAARQEAHKRLCMQLA
ncbi:hypothetical protein ACYPKM_02620 [Pseudomonas aeruginosa]